MLKNIFSSILCTGIFLSTSCSYEKKDQPSFDNDHPLRTLIEKQHNVFDALAWSWIVGTLLFDFEKIKNPNIQRQPHARDRSTKEKIALGFGAAYGTLLVFDIIKDGIHFVMDAPYKIIGAHEAIQKFPTLARTIVWGPPCRIPSS